MSHPGFAQDADRRYVASALLTNALEACLLTLGLERTEHVVARLIRERGLTRPVAQAAPSPTPASTHLLLAVPRAPASRIRWADANDSEGESDDKERC